MLKHIVFFFQTYIWRFFWRSHIHMPLWFNVLFDEIIYLYKKLLRKNKQISSKLCINKEWIYEYNIRYKSFFEKKTYGISGICRVKNWDDFLEQIVISNLDLCDEIIIVDNNSSDNTKKIAQKLVEKFPTRIQYYVYSFETKKLHTKDFWSQPSNSVYSFAYASNYAISLAKYSWIIKVDDDNLLIQEKAENLRRLIMNNVKKITWKYINYWWVNIMKNADQIWVSAQYPYSWLWDHWMFQLSPYTYFMQWESNEYLVHPYKRYRFWFLFLHLKLLKKHMWRTNYTEERKNELIEQTLKKWTKPIHNYVKNLKINIKSVLSSNNII